MLTKKLILFFLCFSSSAVLAGFTNIGCPKSNASVRIHLSQTMAIHNSYKNYAGMMTPDSPTYRAMHPPGQGYYGTTTSPYGGTTFPSVPPATPKINGQCTRDINCPAGYVCSRSANQFVGYCRRYGQ